eukprot:CAMPEP_0113878012 /NCGR_PEP_ID=MMETSP0780_2-20120614/6430_1 /TAXON_ID=652834 /ORGANISM="Palpitomonas bilix" /LENGTH=471 /DNA_ID=CAMNT_0000864403 /DNA_START=217 /DNA_END=1633 /DNA_ORIENTATION=- /assembly_acc=CAM_ASM_000599
MKKAGDGADNVTQQAWSSLGQGVLEDFAKAIQDGGVSPNTTDAEGNSFLHWAALHGRTAILSFLLQKGAMVDAVNTAGQTPLHWAAMSLVAEGVQKLLLAGAKLEAEDSGKATPLIIAVQRGQVAAAKMLLINNADMLKADVDGNTPLHWAAHLNHELLLRELLARGVDQFIPNANQRIPLQAAAKKGNIVALSVLFEFLDVKQLQHALKLEDANGKTMMAVAVEDEHFDIIRHLKRMEPSSWDVTAAHNASRLRIGSAVVAVLVLVLYFMTVISSGWFGGVSIVGFAFLLISACLHFALAFFGNKGMDRSELRAKPRAYICPITGRVYDRYDGYSWHFFQPIAKNLPLLARCHFLLVLAELYTSPVKGRGRTQETASSVQGFDGFFQSIESFLLALVFSAIAVSALYSVTTSMKALKRGVTRYENKHGARSRFVRYIEGLPAARWKNFFTFWLSMDVWDDRHEARVDEIV